MVFGDELIPLILFVLALYFRNRFFAIASVMAGFLNLILRFSSIIMYKEAFMSLNYSSCKLLIIHTDFNSLQAIIGKFFYLWAVPAVIAVAALIVFCIVLTWKTISIPPRKMSYISLIVFSALLGISVISNAAFEIFQTNVESQCFSGRPLPMAVYHMVKDAAQEISSSGDQPPVELSEQSRELLREIKVIAPESEKLVKQDLFDRIIIIATESLDYDYIRKNNPLMPPGITPNLDRYSKDFVSMENYFPGAHPTSWALTALLQSRLDYTKDKFLTNESLFSAAGKKGFKSLYFSSASANFDENGKYYKQMFQPDHQFFREDFPEKYDNRFASSWGLSDRGLLTFVYKKFKTYKYPRFIAVISTMDTHPPYSDSLLTKEEKQRFRTKFLGSLFSTDREINAFVTKIMSDQELYNERTLIIITADHTATFGDNFTKRPDLYPGRIPLIFITPNQEIFQNLNTKKYASSIDLAPTLLNMIDAEIPESFMGRDLFSDKNCAIVMPYNPFMIIHTPHGEQRFFITAPTNRRQEAFRDFFYSYYGK